jgi:hypothetical protein
MSACLEQYLHSRERAIFAFHLKLVALEPVQFLFFLQRQPAAQRKNTVAITSRKNLQLSTVASL